MTEQDPLDARSVMEPADMLEHRRRAGRAPGAPALEAAVLCLRPGLPERPLCVVCL